MANSENGGILRLNCNQYVEVGSVNNGIRKVDTLALVVDEITAEGVMILEKGSKRLYPFEIFENLLRKKELHFLLDKNDE